MLKNSLHRWKINHMAVLTARKRSAANKAKESNEKKERDIRYFFLSTGAKWMEKSGYLHLTSIRPN